MRAGRCGVQLARTEALLSEAEGDLAHELKQTVHQSGRIITVVVAGAPAGLSEEQLRFLQSTRNSDTETWLYSATCGEQWGLKCGGQLESTVQPVGSNGKTTYVTVGTDYLCGFSRVTMTMKGEIDEFGNRQWTGSYGSQGSHKSGRRRSFLGHFRLYASLGCSRDRYPYRANRQRDRNAGLLSRLPDRSARRLDADFLTPK